MDETAPRVPLLQRSDLTDEIVAAYDHVAATRGREHTIFRTLAHNSGVFEPVTTLGESLRWSGGIDARVRELVILTVAMETRCEYEWTHHWLAAKGLGLDPTAALSGASDYHGPGDLMSSALALARHLCRGERVSADLIADLRCVVGDSGVIELVVLVGYYRMLADIVTSCRVPLEDDVASVPFL